MLKKIRSLVYQHAIPATFIIFVLLEVILSGLGKLFSLLPKHLLIQYLCEIILIIIPIALVFLFGFSRTFKKGHFFRGLLYCLPLIVVQVIALIIFFAGNLGNPEANWKPWYLIIFELFTIIGVGIREECIYRATLQNIVAKKHANSVKGIWITVIIGAVIFGLCHVSNIFFGVEWQGVIKQVISATFVGVLFGAVYLRSGSIWTLILVHTLTDVAGLARSIFLNVSDVEIMSGLSFSWISLIFDLFYVGLAIFLLRPSKCKQVYENLCFADEKTETPPLS